MNADVDADALILMVGWMELHARWVGLEFEVSGESEVLALPAVPRGSEVMIEWYEHLMPF